MRQVVIVSGVLGGGTALVFSLAAVVAAAFPTGTLVPNAWDGGWRGGPVGIGGGGVQVFPGKGQIMIDDAGNDVPDIGTDIVVPPDAAPPVIR